MKRQLSIALGMLCLWTGAVLAADAAHVSAPAPAPVITVGDSWTYQYTDLWKHTPGNLNRIDITAVDADGVHAEIRRAVGNALVTRQRYSSDMNPIDRGKMHFAPAFGRYAFPLEPGKTWKTDAIGDNKEAGKHWRFQVTGHAGEWEKITVAAGQFDAIKIDIVGYYQLEMVNERAGSGTLRETLWYAPSVQNFIKLEYQDTDAQGRLFNRDAWELTAFVRK